ncbi:metallophosphoesterase [Bacillus sp. S/N-304-OC-R1]|uniref:metallophosphoesterase family protein n=1 Tax=Bacillus sp. S/N-304-OC-R1 TaxID=2758034 RepID=UPI001C8E090F|nr:metallophosphoesterase family protein [Bacillus sp. S/N-304-OC-R1]MBY0122208.1 metallophosphoesterase family protein [Bacillus sp. S/N-304-OC-R1]
MGSIAVISDIHGNITALEAVLDDIKARGIDTIFCLGDLVGKGPNSQRAVERIRDICEVVVLGNWDDFIQKPAEIEEVNWYKAQLSKGSLDYLSTLPFHHDFYMSGKYVRLFHASAKSVYHRVVPMRDSYEEKLAMFDNTEKITHQGILPDVVGYGDIHAALIEPVRPQKILFNAGSVGNSLDIPQATYTILHGEYLSAKPSPFSIEIIRIPYDIEKEIAIAKEMGLPNLEAYALELREAKYRGAYGAKG